MTDLSLLRIEDHSDLHEQVLKITEALYRTTALFSESEPLKWSLRDAGVKILNSVSAFEQNMTHSQIKELESLKIFVRGMFLKLELASSGTFVARSNFDVLKREYALLFNDIMKKHINSSRSDFFSSDLSKFSRRKQIVKKNKKAGESQKEIISDKKASDSINMSDTNTIRDSNDQISISDRKEVIIGLLRRRGPSSVKEVTRDVSFGVGEKTIQRELNNLVSNGLIKQEGEKRWRRYYL